jgi:hypothetical protein
MAKQQWQVIGKGDDGTPQAMVVTSTTRETAIAFARKNGFDATDASPFTPPVASVHQPLSAAERNAELFPPMTVEDISFSATVKIGVGVFVGVTLATIIAVVAMNSLGMLVSR